jgi:hypothetical protein
VVTTYDLMGTCLRDFADERVQFYGGQHGGACAVSKHITDIYSILYRRAPHFTAVHYSCASVWCYRRARVGFTDALSAAAMHAPVVTNTCDEGLAHDV